MNLESQSYMEYWIRVLYACMAYKVIGCLLSLFHVCVRAFSLFALLLKQTISTTTTATKERAKKATVTSRL